MSLYTGEKVWGLYESSAKAAVRKLSGLRICCGDPPGFAGLNGWVFEKTVQYCLERELRALRARLDTHEQESFPGRMRADLRVGRAVIEIKQSGLFSPAALIKCRKNRHAVCRSGYEYLFLAGGERYRPYREGVVKALGKENAFFLDTSGDWERFVRRVLALYR